MGVGWGLHSRLKDQLSSVCGLGSRRHPRGTPDPPGLFVCRGQDGDRAEAHSATQPLG